MGYERFLFVFRPRRSVFIFNYSIYAAGTVSAVFVVHGVAFAKFLARFGLGLVEKQYGTV